MLDDCVLRNLGLNSISRVRRLEYFDCEMRMLIRKASLDLRDGGLGDGGLER
jgi:hypothetical protein